MNKHFHNLLLGVSVLPALLVMPAVATDVSNATDFANALTSGDTIKVSENISDINVVITSSGKTNNLDLNGKTISGAESATSGFIFANNSSLTMTGGGTISGFSNPDQTNGKVGGDEYGALHIGTGSNLSIVGGDWVFSGNTSGLGAINSTNGSVNANVSTIKFKDNISNAQGGGFRHDVSNAAYNDTIARITADQIIFDNNSFAEGSVVGSGAGVMNSRGRVELLGNTNTFTNNDMNATIASGRQYKVGGGAVANQSGENGGTKFDAVMVIGKADGKSVNNFSNNSSSTSGGAIMNRAVDTDGNAYLTINGTTTFSENTATLNGGAIYNVKRDNEAPGHIADIDMTNGTYTFSKNTAGGNGGAIYNEGIITINSGTFTDNVATANGGAIYSDDLSAITKINNTTFTGNNVSGDEGIGGAIYVYRGTAEINKSTFSNNTADYGGAIYTKARVGNLNTSDLVISNSLFTNNEALEVGAVGVMRKGVITDTNFIGNKAKNTTVYPKDGGAGALFLGAESYTTLTRGKFDSNTSGTRGAALATRTFAVGDNTIAKLDILGTVFSNNIATTNGGAIDNFFYNDAAGDGYVKVSGAKFESNKAANGGAIYNHKGSGSDLKIGGEYQIGSMYFNDATFTGNIATTNGGAIYNEGALTLAGANVFSGNTANDVVNDIHNLGTLNIASGTTVLDGGITGNGTLTVTKDSVLNIGKATITQGTINLGGTLIAELVDDGAPIFDVEYFNNVDNKGTLSLAIEKEGTYNLFNNAVFDKAQEQVISAVYDLDWTQNSKTVIATKKSVEDIAADNNIATEAASTISHIADAAAIEDAPKQMKELSVKLQEKLISGDAESVEHATKAIHPETESVAQSVSTSTQNTIVNLASARMAAPTVGRNGGDVKLTSGGIWVQGLFNKSKQADLFNGYTRGIAAGLDGTINKHWTIGAGYSFAHSDISGTARDTKIDSNTVFLYGQYKPAQWYVNAVANYTSSEYSEKGTVIENIPIFADYNVKSFGGHVATGYDFKNGITPELGLRYMHVTADDYLNSYGIKTHMDDTNFLTGIFGAKYSFDVVASKHTIFAPQLNAGIKYDLLSDKNVATITMPGLDSYTLDGNRLNRFGGEFGAGLGMKYYNLDISVNYDIDVRQDYTSQTGMLKFRCNF